MHATPTTTPALALIFQTAALVSARRHGVNRMGTGGVAVCIWCGGRGMDMGVLGGGIVCALGEGRCRIDVWVAWRGRCEDKCEYGVYGVAVHRCK